MEKKEMVTNTSGDLSIQPNEMNQFQMQRYLFYLQEVSQDGMKLTIIPEQTKEIALMALYNNPAALQYVVDQTQDIVEFAIQSDYTTLAYVREQTPEIIKFAVQQNVRAIRLANKLTPELVSELFDINPMIYVYLNSEFKTIEVSEKYVDYLAALITDDSFDSITINTSHWFDFVPTIQQKEILKYAINKHYRFLVETDISFLDEDEMVEIGYRNKNYAIALIIGKYYKIPSNVLIQLFEKYKTTSIFEYNNSDTMLIPWSNYKNKEEFVDKFILDNEVLRVDFHWGWSYFFNQMELDKYNLSKIPHLLKILTKDDIKYMRKYYKYLYSTLPPKNKLSIWDRIFK